MRDDTINKMLWQIDRLQNELKLARQRERELQDKLDAAQAANLADYKATPAAEVLADDVKQVRLQREISRMGLPPIKGEYSVLLDENQPGPLDMDLVDFDPAD